MFVWIELMKTVFNRFRYKNVKSRIVIICTFNGMRFSHKNYLIVLMKTVFNRFRYKNVKSRIVIICTFNGMRFSHKNYFATTYTKIYIFWVFVVVKSVNTYAWFCVTREIVNDSSYDVISIIWRHFFRKTLVDNLRTLNDISLKSFI